MLTYQKGVLQIYQEISQEMLMNFICNMCLEITLSKLLVNLPEASELRACQLLSIAALSKPGLIYG